MNKLATIEDLESLGFVGGVSVRTLRDRSGVVPREPGVYCVAAPSDLEPRWLQIGTGGFFKGKDPNVGLLELERNWVRTSLLLYFGRASAGKANQRGLKKRTNELVRFGMGEAVGHWGGRLLWQIEQSDTLLLFWKTSEEPEVEKARLIEAFLGAHGSKPFAVL
ncbi:hypothetical protein [Algicella marina]|uniref:Uncharacterized protein n=1 Tax=Algicella marina TaxID=2683284 RepID=A0A6P1T079_9RHOB|nr:hypothetical protein [Algicella marina]QHQ33902.1 hypothetical protein GO499_01245 [Algicella marina]